MNSELNNALVVHISAEHTVSFVRNSPGLYYFGASSVTLSKLRHALTFLTTVSDKKRHFGQRYLRKAYDSVTLNRRANHMPIYLSDEPSRLASSMPSTRVN